MICAESIDKDDRYPVGLWIRSLHLRAHKPNVVQETQVSVSAKVKVGHRPYNMFIDDPSDKQERRRTSARFKLS